MKNADLGIGDGIARPPWGEHSTNSVWLLTASMLKPGMFVLHPLVRGGGVYGPLQGFLTTPQKVTSLLPFQGLQCVW